MQTINNKWWVNAQISDDAIITEDGMIWPDFHSGVWYDGIWHMGDWLGGIWLNGVWHDGTWSSGYWLNGNIVKRCIIKNLVTYDANFVPISPKSFYKPKSTLSLNYANYKE